jgi:hypothetical protein
VKSRTTIEPVYVDIHIHTSDNPDKLVSNYDVSTLLAKVREKSNGVDFLISLTDHNTINKSAYLDIIEQAENVLLGAELHIQNYEEKAPYHCHIIFNLPSINEEQIDNVNIILDKLYTKKNITEGAALPGIEQIRRDFDEYDFLLLPHGGQSHSTFDKSIPDNIKFDRQIERNIYYNSFDGFTARGNKGLDKTKEYFKRLGIADFVNLVTCSDNYKPTTYPSAKDKNAKKFVPTWMYANPTFDGLRLSLSESSRFFYGDKPPQVWGEHIGMVSLHNDKIDIDVQLTPGLNVIIGGSSSGKTLFVDSIYNKARDNFDDSSYLSFDVEQIEIENPALFRPHYLSQNFVTSVLTDSDRKINEIDIISEVFPQDETIEEQINKSLANLKEDLRKLVKAVESIEATEKALRKIPILSQLISDGNPRENILQAILPTENQLESYSINSDVLEEYKDILGEIRDFLKTNPFTNDVSKEIKSIEKELNDAFLVSEISGKIANIIYKQHESIANLLQREEQELQTKGKQKRKLLESIKKYISALNTFLDVLQKIASYDVSFSTQPIQTADYEISIKNSFMLSKEKVLEAFNACLKGKIGEWEDITPEILFRNNYLERPKIGGYSGFVNRVHQNFESRNKTSYKIIDKNGRDFENLSPGWKSAAILDIVLGYDEDVAPLIIDQPEDNLASNYINTGLIQAIKSIKQKKQIILVSHNATIPMLGDAQTVILCNNLDDKIKIRSAPLEGEIDGKSMVDHIAEITDGGKASIKKRVKKYNLKSFKE